MIAKLRGPSFPALLSTVQLHAMSSLCVCVLLESNKLGPHGGRSGDCWCNGTCLVSSSQYMVPPTVSCSQWRKVAAAIMFAVVLSEKMEICRVQCWGGGGQLGANRGQPCAACLLHSDLLSTIYPLQDNNGTLKT